jgi:hypothetical protein
VIIKISPSPSFPKRGQRTSTQKSIKLKFLCLFIIPALSIVSWELNTYAQQPKIGEYEVKAAFLYNFTKFVEWPTEATTDAGATFNLCVLGEDPFGKAFDSIQGEKIVNKKLVINRFKELHALEKCRILYISESEEERLTQILKSLKGLHILTVSDSEGFAQHGVIINFYMEGNRVRFEINVDAARRSGLKISSKLLNLAKIVYDVP